MSTRISFPILSRRDRVGQHDPAVLPCFCLERAAWRCSHFTYNWSRIYTWVSPTCKLCFSPPCPPTSFRSLFWLINDSQQKEAKMLGSERQRKVYGTGHLQRDLSSSACSLYWLCGFSSVSSPLWVSVILWFIRWNILLCPISGTELLKTLRIS